MTRTRSREASTNVSSKTLASRANERPGQPLCHSLSEKAWVAAHEAIKSNETLWASLAVDGIQGDGLGGLFEQRRCPACGSTIARRTTALAAVRILATLGQIQAQSLDTIVSAAEAVQRINPHEQSSSDS